MYMNTTTGKRIIDNHTLILVSTEFVYNIRTLWPNWIVYINKYFRFSKHYQYSI